MFAVTIVGAAIDTGKPRKHRFLARNADVGG